MPNSHWIRNLDLIEQNSSSPVLPYYCLLVLFVYTATLPKVMFCSWSPFKTEEDNLMGLDSIYIWGIYSYLHQLLERTLCVCGLVCSNELCAITFHHCSSAGHREQHLHWDPKRGVAWC